MKQRYKNDKKVRSILESLLDGSKINPKNTNNQSSSERFEFMRSQREREAGDRMKQMFENAIVKVTYFQMIIDFI